MSLFCANSLPSDTLLPIHWDEHFQPDGYGNKWLALLVLPGVSVFIAILFKIIPYLEPNTENLEKSSQAFQAAFWAVQVFLLVIQAFFINNAWDWGLPMERFMSVGIGLMFIILGNYLGKTRSTYVLGIRTPWTLRSETIWEKVHRAAGLQLFILGFLLLCMTPWISNRYIFVSIGTMGGIFGMASFYSYVLWKRLETEPQTKN